MRTKITSDYGKHPIVQYVRSLPGDFYLTNEAAEMVGCSPAALRHVAVAHGHEGFGPSHKAKYGSIELGLYSAERIERLRERFFHADGTARTAGRPALWTPDERRARRLALERCRVARHRVKELREAGEIKKADRAEKKIDKEYARLIAERDKRAEMLGRRRKKTRKKSAA